MTVFFSTGDILVGCRCGCGCDYERGCGYCSGWGYAHERGCALARGCCGADCGNSLGGMPGGPSVGTAVGGDLTGTGMCRNAESHTAAHSSSRLDTSDGVKNGGKHKVAMLEEKM